MIHTFTGSPDSLKGSHFVDNRFYLCPISNKPAVLSTKFFVKSEVKKCYALN
jgi:hypothetical protein